VCAVSRLSAGRCQNGPRKVAGQVNKSVIIRCTLFVSIAVSVLMCSVMMLGTMLVLMDWMGGGQVKAWSALSLIAYQVALISIPFLGLIIVRARPGMAVALQLLWIVVALPSAWFFVVSAIPPAI
jgi:hypothetical protein